MHAPPHPIGHFHLHVHPISKLKGHNIRAAAAYRRAELFPRQDHSVTHASAYQRAQRLGNNGDVFDYRRKLGVTWTGIFAPAHTPPELLNAQTLWNTVERIEHRKNARLAREMIIALPHQVNQDVHVAMLRAFISANLVSRGIIADVAIHRPPVEHGGDPRNWHAHVLLTDRPMTPTGFAATKDRTWNAKDNVNLWRKAWADTHNDTMQTLGLPHRIDHRSLEAQRQEALAHGNTIVALDLDRTPQIHVGRDVYASRRTKQLAPKALGNRQILNANQQRAFQHKDRLDAAIAKADTAVYLESRSNADYHAAWDALPVSLEDLRRAYGRPPAKTALGRFKDAVFDSDVTRRALAVSRSHGHPWRQNGHHADAPSVMEVLRPMVKTTGPGHPVFTVTAKDLAFAFFGLGFISQRELQTALEHITQEEQRLFAERLAKSKRRPPPPLHRPKLPALPTPEAQRLKRLQRAAVVPQQIFLKRFAQLKAFDDRHRIDRLGRARLARRRQISGESNQG